MPVILGEQEAAVWLHGRRCSSRANRSRLPWWRRSQLGCSHPSLFHAPFRIAFVRASTLPWIAEALLLSIGPGVCRSLIQLRRSGQLIRPTNARGDYGEPMDLGAIRQDFDRERRSLQG